MEQKTKEFLALSSLDLNILCINVDQTLGELHITAIGNQGIKDYIFEAWFQYTIGLHHHSILQQFLAPSFQGKLVSHILALLNLDFFSCGYEDI